MVKESILFWNCRGAGSREFLCEIKELMKEHHPSILILLESRISGATADGVCKKLGMRSWIRSKARGFSGGVWVLWDDAAVQLDLAYDDYFFLHLLARSADGRLWEVVVVYASPKLAVWRSLWGKLDGICVSRQWVIVGDFNCMLLDDERNSNSGASSSFQRWVELRGLLDLGFVGS